MEYSPYDFEEGEPLSEDRLFTLLAARRRRVLLRALEETGGEAPLPDVTRRVAIEEGFEPDAPTSEYKRVYVSLYQTHVPALAEAGVVDYDEGSSTVRLTERARPLLEHLRADFGADQRGFFSRLFRSEPPRTTS